ncbi:MAG: glycoside hydrolase [bacterium]|nr:glycoside hydrolase [bacterium]
MTAQPLSVAVLWHMHQPDYTDAALGRPRMPWVRLHALLSYYDMVRYVVERPGARAVFNVVPSLLRQIEAAAAGVPDDHLLLARAAPADLDAADRARIVRDFFAFHHARRFAEFPRLRELWELRGAGVEVPAGRAERFTDRDLLDLQVLFHLAWCGRTLREDPAVARLVARGAGYTAADKDELLALQHAFLQGVLPAYREAAARGVLEISCTPLNHPILPLLCDTGAAHEALPHLTLPSARFRYPGDAWYHVKTALDETERVLGVRPRGMWPAEGSVSEAALRVLQTEGIRWAATDQGVLARSLERGGQAADGRRHFQAWRWGGDGAPALFFRDTGLSDALGFRYQSWRAPDAVADLLGHLRAIRAELPDRGAGCVVPIVLDGENPWEFYEHNGRDFLQDMYRAVAEAPDLRWTTFGEHLDSGGRVGELTRVCAGSWIRADFTTWVGHAEKNRGWEYLARVRDRFQGSLAAAGALRRVRLAGGAEVEAPDPAHVGPGCAGNLAAAMTAMANAESSDWFWWYGDDNPTDYAREFDTTFRRHLSQALELAGAEADPGLDIPVLRAGGQA